jgi:DNA-binding winged helix-turn-helix (wHTH) protein
MNVANVIPLSARQAVPYAKSGRPAALDPVRVRFDRFELDEANARLFDDGMAVALPPTPFAVLCALVRRPGSLLTTNALLDDVWGHRFVTDSVLRTAISELRTALDDDARKPRFIETVSRRGYRFIAATTAISTTTTMPSAARALGINSSEHPSLKRSSQTLPHPRGAAQENCSGKGAVVCPIRTLDTPACESDCGLPKPVFATMEEVRYAHELRLQLRARLLRNATPAAEPLLYGTPLTCDCYIDE